MAEYNLLIKSPYSFFKSADYLAAVKLHCDLLPQYMPMKWGWAETRTQFDPNHIEQLVFENGEVDHVYWRRTGKDRAFGSWSTRLRNVAMSKATHGSIRLDVYKTNYQEDLLRYLKKASQRFDADISIMDSCADQYKSIGVENEYAPSASSIFLTTLRHWLPDMPWAVVFGPAYIRLFGKEKLLTCPAYKIEEIGDEMVFIQLTQNMGDIHQKYDEVMQARVSAKKHLGEECFSKPELAYDYTEYPEKAGKIFRVPVFELQPD